MDQSGRFKGSVVNPDSGTPIYSGDADERLLSSDFKKVRLSEWLETAKQLGRRIRTPKGRLVFA